MKKQIANWMTLSFLTFPTADCQDKDPSGKARGTAEETKPLRISTVDLDRLMQKDALLLDVRKPSELEELGTLEEYVNIPIDQLEEHLDDLPRDRLIVTA